MIALYLLIFVLLLALYKLVYQPLVYWRKRNLPYETPLPIVGSLGNVILKRISFFDNFQAIYERNKHHRCVGFFQMTMPTLLINDLELIKQVTVKCFDHFMDHRSFGDPTLEILMSKNLISLQGQEWKDMRSLQSPAFTGSKMKLMSGLMAECARKFTAHYEEVVLANEKHGKVFEVEVKNLFRKYTNDAIATCAYGLECDSIKEPDNQFFTMGCEAINFSGGLNDFKMMIVNFAPAVAKWLKLTMFSSEVTDFFLGIIKETIKYRTENNVTRPDMIQVLLDARKGKAKHEEEPESDQGIDTGFAVVKESEVGRTADIKKSNPDSLTDESITAQAFVFFIAGFDNISLQLSLMAAELAICPDVQEKLYEEVKEVMTKCKGEPTYAAITGMKYLDMVLSETMRKWPQEVNLDRRSNKDCVLKSENEDHEDIHVKTGDILMVSLVGIHRDPKYFPDPMKFDPERFNDENKRKIVPYTYLPFGMGPRACIASRFAVLKVKMFFVYFLARFQFEVIDKTHVPITVSAKKLVIEPDNGFWLGLKLRSHS